MLLWCTEFCSESELEIAGLKQNTHFKNKLNANENKKSSFQLSHEQLSHEQLSHECYMTNRAPRKWKVKPARKINK
jgi:hypothetical protein